MVEMGKPNRERGAASVEAALSFMVFIIILFSLFDFGWTLFLHQSYVNQARYGARWGAINPSDTNAIKNVVLYNSQTGSGTGYLGLDPTNVTVSRLGTAGTTSDRIVVTISGFTFFYITPGYAGQKTGKPIIVSVPVEN
jgi:hypothetical protein